MIITNIEDKDFSKAIRGKYYDMNQRIADRMKDDDVEIVFEQEDHPEDDK